MNVNIDLLGSYSIDTLVDIFWGNEYARYRNRFAKLNELTMFGIQDGDVRVSNIREGKELVQKYIDTVLNNISTLKGKMEKTDKLKPPNLDLFTTQANVVIRIDDLRPARAGMSLREINIVCTTPSLSQTSKKQLKQTTISTEKTRIRTILNGLEQNSVSDFNNKLIVIWQVNINVKCKL